MQHAKRIAGLIFLILTLAVITTGCSPGPAAVDPTGQPPTREQLSPPLTFAAATASPAATPTLAATSTPAAVGTLTPTPAPGPSIEEVRARYRAEIAPLAVRLEAAQPPPEGVAPPSLDVDAIRLVPLDERLYYVQTVLYPERDPLPADQTGVPYVVYGYAREGDLSPMGVGPASTQGVTATVRLVAEVDGALALLDEVEGYGGPGAPTYDKYSIVQGAVRPLDALGGAAGGVERALENVLISGTEIGVFGFLGELTPPQKMAYVLWLLDSPYWVERAEAARLLGSSLGGWGVVPAEEAIPRLIEVLADEDERTQVREQAAYSLGQFGRWPAAKDAIPLLLALLEDEDEADSLRIGAIYALGQMGPAAADAVPYMLAILQDEAAPSGQRGRAAEALGLIGVEREQVIPALIDALGDEDEDLRENAAGALRTLTGEGFGADTAAWRAWWDEQN
jgi:hypothetical protein